MNRPELLAPAGSLENLKTAVRHGADAVYFGAQRFSARAHATNFTLDDIKEGIDFCHAHGVNAYCAMNTLIFNNEVSDAIDSLYSLAEAGIDGLIVQDIGLASLIRNHLPSVPLHGSTQMVIHNVEGAKALEESGFSRVVLARECSLDEIATIASQTNIELEVFVHGALCVSYSGACLMSSYCGGRSGNRGDCAQPCRKHYELQKSDGTIIKDGYLLSPKDLNTYDHLPDLLDIGVKSLKIEGRMKKNEYIAAVTAAYRRRIDTYLDGATLSKEVRADDQCKLAQAFNRGGFTSGYWYGNQAADLISIHSPKNQGRVIGDVISFRHDKWTVQIHDNLQLGDGFVIRDEQYNDLASGYLNKIFNDGHPVAHAASGDIITIQDKSFPSNLYTQKAKLYKTFDKTFTKDVQIKDQQRRIDHLPQLNFHLYAKTDEPFRAVVTSSNHCEPINIETDYIVQSAQKKPTDIANINAQLSRLGDVPFALGKVSIESEEDIFIPTSILNQLRRDAVKSLLKYNPPLADKNIFLAEVFDDLDRIPPQMRNQNKPNIAVHVSSLSQAKAAINSGADELVYNLTPLKTQSKWKNADLNDIFEMACEKEVLLSVTAANILFTNQLKDCMDRFKFAANLGIKKCYAGNIGLLRQLLSEKRFPIIAADYALNITNDITINTLMHAGVSEAVLSPELGSTQIGELSMIGNIPLGVIVAGDYPLMTSEYCAIGSWSGDRSIDMPCSMPCVSSSYMLKTKDNRIHPLATDEHCHMMVLGDRMLLLYEHVNELYNLSLDVWRIEGRFMTEHQIESITAIFRDARNRLNQSKSGFQNKDFESVKKSFKRCFTDTHFKRGIRI